MTDKLRPFCVVLRDDDDRLYRHATIDAAMAEAKRLAANHPDHAFFTLVTKAAAGPVRPPMPITHFDMDLVIPF